VKKLYSYYRGNNLVSVIESYLSFVKITQEERSEITRLFNKLDTDNSGTIDINELREAFTLCTEGECDAEVEHVLSKIDKNKSKKIDLNEFVTALFDRKKLFHENSLLLAFDYFDNDHNGYIDKK
jgi:calcium-dependent protein kinase